MFVSKSKIKDAIKSVTNEAIEVLSKKLKSSYIGLVPVVYIAQISPRKYHVGWNFQNENIKLHDAVNYDQGTRDYSSAIIVAIINYL